MAPRPIAYFETWNAKIDEYFAHSCGIEYLIRQWHRNFPICKFSIPQILASFAEKGKTPEEIEHIGMRLLDIKLPLCYKSVAFNAFGKGPALIVGNDEIEKLNPNTMSVLQLNHYKVYLLAVIVEKTLNLMQLVYTGKIEDYKKDKWEKIVKALPAKCGDVIIGPEALGLLQQFKRTFRTAEMHKNSMVRAFVSKSQWNHLIEEEKAVDSILGRLFDDLTTP